MNTGLLNASASPGASVMVVDDSRETLELFNQILGTAGYRVRCADSGELALAAAVLEPPELVLLDVKLPRISGLEVCRRLREDSRTRHVPIILTSAYAGVDDWVEGLKVGAMDYLSKPCQAQELLVRVATHLSLAKARQAAAEAAALREHEQRLKEDALRLNEKLLGATSLGVMVHDEAGQCVLANEAAAQVLAGKLEDFRQRNFQDLPFAGPTGLLAVDREVLADGRRRHLEISLPTPTPVVLDCTLTRFEAHGRPHLLLTLADVTERKRLLEQTAQDARDKSELLREVNHRVANNLTSILGLIASEAGVVPAAEQAQVKPVLDRLGKRIRSLLDVHRMLSDYQWAPMRLDRLAETVIRAAVAADPGRLDADVQVAPSDLRVSPRQASNLALILNELTTNTIKHARTATRPRLGIAVATGADGERINLCYRDNGPGFPPEVLAGRRANVGLRLIRQLATETLQGELTLANREGAETCVRFRIEEPSPRSPAQPGL